MEEKEERILIARSTDYTLTDTDKGELFEGKIAPHCANVMTHQEAIERMAKAIYDEEIGRCNEEMCAGKECRDCFRWKKCEYVAEAALNALLEGK